MQGMITSKICRIKIYSKTIGDCGFLQASCDTHFGCFAYALGQTDENPCYCTCIAGFVELETPSTFDGVTYNSTCEFETACDRHKETLTGGDCGVHAFCDESTGAAQCHCEDGFVNWSDGSGCVRHRVVNIRFLLLTL